MFKRTYAAKIGLVTAGSYCRCCASWVAGGRAAFASESDAWFRDIEAQRNTLPRFVAAEVERRIIRESAHGEGPDGQPDPFALTGSNVTHAI